ncbi:MAG TPA: hypothetical protein VND94_00695 [Terriglobia bacterium]|nr:hypothetical protein [Terriglobia bacterium]
MKRLLKWLFDVGRLTQENHLLRLSIVRAINAIDDDDPTFAAQILEDAVRK